MLLNNYLQGFDQLSLYDGTGGDGNSTQVPESNLVPEPSNVASDPYYEKAKRIYDGRYGAGAYDKLLGRMYDKAVDVGSPAQESLSHQPSIDKTLLQNSPLVSDAKSYADLEGMNVEEQLNWLIQHDPDNATGWMESLIGLRAERENIQSARDYEKLMQDTRYQRAAKDLEAAGINPILAYQFVNGGSSSVGSAGYSSSDVFSTATSRKTTQETKGTTAAASIVAALIAAMAMIGKALI